MINAGRRRWVAAASGGHIKMLPALPMDAARIAALLAPCLGGHPLTDETLARLGTYLALLLRWNEKTNLTAVRGAEEMVTRHFGESLFAATRLMTPPALRVADVGSGAGFPGLPLAIYAPPARVTLIESQGKKVAFLKEVIRAAGVSNASVFAGRAEACPDTFDLVNMRAVERFQSSLPLAARLVAPGGRLALMISSPQVKEAVESLPELHWADPVPVPGSEHRVLLVGRRA
jgi:16S rRNA (guanine527-N7)-methyltransferase